MAKRIREITSLILSVLLILSVFQGCGANNSESSESKATVDEMNSTIQEDETYKSFESLSDPGVVKYMESAVYDKILEKIDSSKYAVQNVEAVYVSKEYIEESSYNSKANIYFGYTLDELEKQFQGKKFVFSLGDDGKTTVKEFEAYDDTYEKMIKNVAIGTGVILVCVVISVVTEGAGAPAAAAIFAASAKTGAIAALSSAVIGGTAAAAVTGIETNDFNETLKAAALEGSEGYKWGAITGALTGAAGEFVALHGATKGGLTMNQVAAIQKESKYPLDVIKQLNSMDQYNILKEAGLTPKIINGKTALIRKIDLNYVDEMGRTNLQRIKLDLSPLDPTGTPYELHHVGQQTDSTLAILTRQEHRIGDNYKIWHEVGKGDNPTGAGKNWGELKKQFWKAYVELIGG